jgi:pilus assembly protein CpaC
MGTAAVIAALLWSAGAILCDAQDLPAAVQAPPSIAAPAITVSGAAAAPGAAMTVAMPTVSVLKAPTMLGTLSSTSRTAGDGSTLHVMLGHSMFIDTKTRLRRVYISDPGVLNSVTLSPNQIIVTAMNPGICSLTLLDENGLAQTYMVSSDLDLDGLRTALAGAVPGDSVKVSGSGGRITLSGTVSSAAMSDEVVKLASSYSRDVANTLVVAPSHPKQVRLQVRILEVDRSKLLQLGVNIFNPGGTNGIQAGMTSAQFPSTATLTQAVSSTASATVSASNPLSFLLYSAKLNLGATIQDLQTKQVLQILAEPTITTISGVKADFLSGGEFPFPSVQSGGTGGTPTISVEFRSFGVKLEFTPIVNDDGTIRLKVAPEVSALDYSNAITLSGITVPALSSRRASTEVELRSNQSFAISGLLDQRTTDAMSKNPGAANIPILGNLFKSKNSNRSVTELVVVVTPTVVDPLEEMDVPAQPDLPLPRMDVQDFDKSLGRDLAPNPAAPPIPSDHPPVVPPVFPNSVHPAAAKATNVAPAQDALPVAMSTAPVAIQAASAALPKIPPAARSNETTLPAMPATDMAPHAAQSADPTLTASADTAPRTHAVDRVSALPSTSTAPVTAQMATANSIVEVMAVSHDSDADVMVAALKRHGYDVAINHDPHDSLIHLDMGPFPSKSAAEAMRQKLQRDGYNATLK